MGARLLSFGLCDKQQNSSTNRPKFVCLLGHRFLPDFGVVLAGVGSDRDDADTIESCSIASDEWAKGVASNGRPDSIIHLCSSCIGFDLPVLAFSFIISGLKRVTNPKIASVQVDLRVISSRTQLTCFACFSACSSCSVHLTLTLLQKRPTGAHCSIIYTALLFTLLFIIMH